MNLIKNGALFLFIILVLGLILCSVLGGNCVKEGYENAASDYANKVRLASGVTYDNDDDNDNRGKNWHNRRNNWYNNMFDNYNHYYGSYMPNKFYGRNGSTAIVSTDSSGNYIITETSSSGSTKKYILTSKNTNTNSNANSNANSNTNSNTNTNSNLNAISQFANKTFYGHDGGSARFFKGKNNQYAIEVTKSNGDTTFYTPTNTYTYDYSGQKTSTSYNSFPFTGASSNEQNTNTNTNTNVDGITKNMIPKGQEDLYILKSKIVPPVCPACPANCQTTSKTKCPPCPACARCPEPKFECKKVPNYGSSVDNDGNNDNNDGTNYHNKKNRYDDNSYNQRKSNPYGNYNPWNTSGQSGAASFGAGNPGYLPVPVLSDFSTFGM
jgi:hypothetical protein